MILYIMNHVFIYLTHGDSSEFWTKKISSGKVVEKVFHGNNYAK